MQDLRILADDLSGALDSAVCFAAHSNASLVVRSQPGPQAFACSTGARDLPAAAAAEAFARCLPWLLAAGRPFHKLDSRLRGHAAREIAAIRDAAPDRPIFVAPALPAQNRVMRSGRVWSRESPDAAWACEPVVLADELRSLDHDVRIGPDPGVPPSGWISLWDTETDDDLDAVAAAAIAQPGAILCGSSGLAAALARALRIPPPARRQHFGRPMLLIAGTAHPRTLRQIAHLDAASPRLHRAIATEAPDFDSVAAALADGTSLLITPHLPAGSTGPQISAQISAWLRGIAHHLPRPGSLFVTGGETLDVLTGVLGAEGLVPTALFSDGVPVSRIAGGRWDGLVVVSKSGGFGPDELISRLVIDHF